MLDIAEMTFAVVDVAAPYANLPEEVHRAAFGYPYGGPDWRFEITFPDGATLCMNAGASALDTAIAALHMLPTHRAPSGDPR